MQKITPHFCYYKEAKEATALYASLFPDSKVNNITTITGTPSGDCDIVTFTLCGQVFMAISAGPHFKLNPSISLFVTFDNEEELENVWNALSPSGKVLMGLNTYPWAKKYGWLQDKFGLSWQLSISENHAMKQRITPMLMFTGGTAGKAEEAMNMYTSIFPSSEIEVVVRYGKDDGDQEGYMKHARFSLDGDTFMAMDSSVKHELGFNEALSFIVKCDNQEEIDYYWNSLSFVPEREQCGWCKDKYGISWQIVPTVMDEMMASGDKEKIAKVTEAFMKMKKFDIATLKEAYEK